MKKLLHFHIIIVLTFTPLSVILAQPGSFNLTSPSNGSFTNATPYFDWSTSGNATYYQLYIDAVLKKDSIYDSYYQIDSTEALTENMHTWYVVAVGSGTTQSGETWSFFVDATPPSAFDLVSPSDNSWTADLQPSFTWSASSDAGSGLEKYQLWIDDFLYRDNISPSATSTTPQYTLSNGNHSWRIKAVDIAGNYTYSTQTFSVNIDNNPPLPNQTCLYFSSGGSNYVYI